MAIDILALAKRKPQKIDYVLPGLVAGTVGAIISPGGTGKSALALQIAAQVAGGPDLLGIGDVSPGSAAYLPGEDPELVIEHRMFALLEHCSPEHREALAEQLLVEPLEQYDVDILDDRWLEALMRVAQGRRLLILDTLRMAHNGEENDGGEMKQVIGRLRIIAAQTGCTILFLHHTNKASMFAGAGGEQQASRGSSVLVDNIRWQGYLRNMTTEEADQYGVDEDCRGFFTEFGVSKQNYGRPIPPRWLRKISCKDEEIEGGYTLQPAVLAKSQPSQPKPSKKVSPAPIVRGNRDDW